MIHENFQYDEFVSLFARYFGKLVSNACFMWSFLICVLPFRMRVYALSNQVCVPRESQLAITCYYNVSIDWPYNHVLTESCNKT